eukprot:TRINITY_DN88045_c0_g1_i1.p1 TRINITY_DN88045_c0_g1~~TRINITY_DN88045_c0_g1_i1.p1  ORF type:complete len:509 (-),score=32.33 TRINITY_DN88045_c0_g1_i1:74-1600(-)
MHMNLYLMLTLASLLLFSAFAIAQNPEPWSLTSEEITQSRNNVSREHISTLTTGNSLEILIDGADFMKSLYQDIELTEEGDFIHGSLFEQEVDIMLVPDLHDPSRHTSLYNALGRAVKRGVTIRILSNMNVLEFYNSLPFCVKLNLMCGYTCCGTDSRHHNFVGGSLHTKMWVIKRQGETVAYNGGIDIAGGRWDTNLHDNSPERQANGNFFHFTAYHDEMVRIRGPAVVDYERNFHQMWNDPFPALFPIMWVPKYEWTEPPFKAYEKGIQLQLLRTVGCKGAKKGYYQNFAPLGEYSAAEGFYKMVRNAKRYLYLVDQFFNFEEGVKAIKEALPHLEAVIILTNQQKGLMAEEREYCQFKALSHLLSDPAQRSKVHIFRLVRDTDPTENIYVHAKMFMADDEYMITGSFGMESAGFTNDMEAGMGLYDPEKKFVKTQRKRIWAEHLGLDENDERLEDPIQGLQEWIKKADSKEWRIRHYFPRNMRKPVLTELFIKIFECEGRCHKQC